MAFDNVTFFEVNLPGQLFSSGDREAEHQAASADGVEPDEGESGGRSKGKLLVVGALLAGVAVAVQRFRSDDEDIEMEYERPGVEVEARDETRPEP